MPTSSEDAIAGTEPPTAPGPLRPGLRPLASALAIALAGLPCVWITPAGASDLGSIPDLAGLWADPRARIGHTLSSDAKRRLARDYGLEPLLPGAIRADIPVTNCNDSGAGSLRSAVAAAASGDRVDARNLTCGTITLTSGQLQVFANDLTIRGPGRNALTIRNGGAPGPNSRVIRHTGTGILTISSVTIADGAVAGVTASPDVVGGCIHSDGTVLLGTVIALGTDKYDTTVRDCIAEGSIAGNGKAAGGAVFAETVLMGNSVVTGNLAISHGVYRSAAAGGGGIFARARVALAGSEVSGNMATNSEGKYGGGGGVALGNATISGQAPSAVFDSTISGNMGRRGGGLFLLTDTVVRNSTVSGNTATTEGGGVWTAGLSFPHVTLANTTIAANRVLAGDPSNPNGGGLLAASGAQVDLQSTLVANNVRGNDNAPDDIGGTDVLSGVNNLVGVWLGTPALPPGTIVGNPSLLPLANNGGRTRTHALGPGSLAINAGNNSQSQSFDQRGDGFPRLSGGGVDIGAIEYSLVDTIFADGFQ